jgi:hypothetical protein
LPVASRARANLTVDFQSDNLKPAIAYLILVGKKNGSMAADSLVFNLKANVDELTAKKIVKFQSQLYKLSEMKLEIENPYDQDGEFFIRILETGEKSDLIRNPFNENSKNIENSIQLGKIMKDNNSSMKQLAKQDKNKPRNL